jgi:hypothetical protein
MKILELFSFGPEYFVLSKTFINKFGINPTLVLSHLIENQLNNKPELIKNEYFLNRIEDISKSTTLSTSKIKNAINKLYKIKLIDVIIKKNDKVYVKILDTNIIKTVITKQDNISKKDQLEKNQIKFLKKKRFKKPTLNELKTYFLEIEAKTEETEIMFDYYESKGWKVGKAPMKCWKSAARNWKRRSEKEESEFPDYYDKEFEKKIGNDNNKVSRYHQHLRKIGWKSSYSPTAGTTWLKK